MIAVTVLKWADDYIILLNAYTANHSIKVHPTGYQFRNSDPWIYNTLNPSTLQPATCKLLPIAIYFWVASYHFFAAKPRGLTRDLCGCKRLLPAWWFPPRIHLSTFYFASRPRKSYIWLVQINFMQSTTKSPSGSQIINWVTYTKQEAHGVTVSELSTHFLYASQLMHFGGPCCAVMRVVGGSSWPSPRALCKPRQPESNLLTLT